MSKRRFKDGCIPLSSEVSTLPMTYNTLSPPRCRKLLFPACTQNANPPQCPSTPMMATRMNHSTGGKLCNNKGDMIPNQDWHQFQRSSLPPPQRQQQHQQQQHQQMQNNFNHISKYGIPSNQLVNGTYPNVYAPPVYPMAGNSRLQSAVSLQSLDQLKSVGMLNQQNSQMGEITMNHRGNYFQQKSTLPSYYQYQQPLVPRRSDSLSRHPGMLNLENSNVNRSEVRLGTTSLDKSTTTGHMSRIRPMDRRRYTQYGINYPLEFESDYIRQRQQQSTVPEQPFMDYYCYRMPTTDSFMHSLGKKLPTPSPSFSSAFPSTTTIHNNNNYNKEGIMTCESTFPDVHSESNTDELVMPLNIRRRRPVNSRRAHVVSAFEQSLNNMSQRLQNLTNTTTKKDSELHELRATIDALRSQTELGLLKKPPINRPCELNRSSTKDTLKQESGVSVGEQQHTINRTSLTNSNLSLTDVEGNQSQGENSTERRTSTSGTKSSGSNSKKNGWLRNSLGKAFRKKSSSIHSQSDLDCPTSPQHSHTYHFPSDNNSNYNSDSRPTLPPDHPSNLPQSPTMDHKGLHIAVCHHSQTNSMTTAAPSSSSPSTGGNNVLLSVIPNNNNQLNGLSPSNSSTSSSSWSASGTSAGGQSNAVDKNDRVNNNNPRTYHSQSGHSNQSGIQNYSDSDKQMKVLSADHAKSALTNSTKLEPDEKSWQDEVKHLKCQLAERESKLTDVQLEALASAHQVDQLRDEMARLYSELKYLRTDNERLQILVSHLQDNQKVLLSNNNNNTMVTNSQQQTAIMCNSLPQAKLSRNIKHAAVNRSLDIDCTVLDNKCRITSLDDDRQSGVSRSAIEEGVSSSSNLFIGLPEMTNNPESLIALVSLALNNSEDVGHKNNEYCISDIKVNSTFNIGIIELSKLQTWKSLNHLLINLFECYAFYLNLNCPRDIQINELKQYCMHVNALNCTWKFQFDKDTTSQSAQLNDNNCPFENPQKLNELLQSHSNNYQTIVQLSIEQFPVERKLNSNEAGVYHDDINENLLSTSKNFNNFIMKTLLNRDILYFYLKLLLTYHFIIFYGTDEIFMKTISQSICDYICTTVSTSVKVCRFNFSDGLHTVDQLIDCITQYINDSNQLSIDNTNEQSSSWWLIVFIESMHQISQEQLYQIINCFKAVHSKHSEEDTTKRCRIYLIGLWMETTSLPISLENPSESSSSPPSTSVHTIPYPDSFHFYTPVQCLDKTVCWIKSEHSLSRLRMIRYLKKHLVHSFVEKFQCQQYMPTLSNPMVLFSQDHLEIFLYQIQCFEDLIQWIEQVCIRVDQFLNDVQNSNENSTTGHHHQHFLNPSIFLNLPFNDPVNCESWFTDIWNKEIVELVQKILSPLKKSSHNSSNYASLSDPTEWVLSTWPWHKIDAAKLSSEVDRLGRQSKSLIRFTEFYQT
ncbi:unnamed protein product [Trichobilharzia szidati]|nr:unnamed protein product [Trichobilharzia szidati]